jgi:hypothetical protein
LEGQLHKLKNYTIVGVLRLPGLLLGLSLIFLACAILLWLFL